MALTLHNRRWYPFIFLTGICAAIAAWFYFVPGHRPELLISAVGGVAGFVYFLYRQHLDEAKLFKELFTEFNTKYDALNDGLNAILFGPSGDSLTSHEREHLFKYFICGEEYFFYKAGFIDSHVWESWYRGMGVFFKHPRIQALWEQDCKRIRIMAFDRRRRSDLKLHLEMGPPASQTTHSNLNFSNFQNLARHLP
jgi:hypothetical protein